MKTDEAWDCGPSFSVVIPIASNSLMESKVFHNSDFIVDLSPLF
jgi:hypothetical protein